MSRAFLSPSRCEPGTTTSPLRRALEGVDPAQVRDLWPEGVVEIRGDLDAVSLAEGEELLRLSPRRGFLFTSGDPAERVRVAGVLAYDATGALAGMEIANPALMPRLCSLDLSKAPMSGSFARAWSIIRPGPDGGYRVYVHQELGHYVAEAVVDALAGLESAAVSDTVSDTRASDSDVADHEVSDTEGPAG
jgi:hypothetical protein